LRIAFVNCAALAGSMEEVTEKAKDRTEAQLPPMNESRNSKTLRRGIGLEAIGNQRLSVIWKF